MAIDPVQHAVLAGHQELEGRFLDDARAQLHTLQADALARGTSGAFQLNTLTLITLSMAGFLLAHYFSAQQRVLEFSVLRATGLSTRQLLTLLMTEGALVVGLGLLAGTVIGYGLSQIMVPHLSRALSEALAGVSIRQALIDWRGAARLYGLLVTFYGLAILTLLGILTRVGVHQALRMGDE